MYSEFMNAATKLVPTAGFVGTGALSASTKAQFDDIIDNVSAVNESPVVIMGAKSALRNLTALSVHTSGTLTWIAESQKEAIAHSGIVGDYEGIPLIEIPNKFEDNSLTTKLITGNDLKKLFIFPVVADFKPVKFIDGGETTLEVTQVGETIDDRQTYEAQRRMGIGTVITRRFGQWTV